MHVSNVVKFSTLGNAFLIGYETGIASSVLCVSLVIYHLVCNSCSWNNNYCEICSRALKKKKAVILGYIIQNGVFAEI